MTISDLAARLRELSKELQKKITRISELNQRLFPNVKPPGLKYYDPGQTPIAELKITVASRADVRISDVAKDVFATLLDGCQHGAFDAPHLADLRGCISIVDGAEQSIPRLLEQLQRRGFDCWGAQPGRGAIERLADAFEALATSGTSAMPTTSVDVARNAPARQKKDEFILRYYLIKGQEITLDPIWAFYCCESEEIANTLVRLLDEKCYDKQESGVFTVVRSCNHHREILWDEQLKLFDSIKDVVGSLASTTEEAKAFDGFWDNEYAFNIKLDAMQVVLWQHYAACRQWEAIIHEREKPPTQDATDRITPAIPTTDDSSPTAGGQKSGELMPDEANQRFATAEQATSGLKQLQRELEIFKAKTEVRKHLQEQGPAFVPTPEQIREARDHIIDFLKTMLHFVKTPWHRFNFAVKGLVDGDAKSRNLLEIYFRFAKALKLQCVGGLVASCGSLITAGEQQVLFTAIAALDLECDAVIETLGPAFSNDSPDGKYLVRCNTDLARPKRAEELLLLAIEGIVAAQLSESLGNKGGGKARSQADSKEQVEKKLTHAADFTSVNWYGTEYTFALGVQSSAVKALWEEWEKSGLGLHQDTIRNSIDAERDKFRMDTTFRNHPAFGTMIQPGGDGRYKLACPDEQRKPSAPKKKKSARRA